MRVKVSLFLLFLVITFSFAVDPVIGKIEAPDFTLVDIDGNSFTLSECPAKVVLINFFGTYSDTCKDEIPTLRSLYDEYPRDQLEIISISPEDEDTLRIFAQQQYMEWIVAQDTAGISNDYGVTYPPITLLVDADGYIRYDHSGWRSGDESELRSKIISLLSGTENGDSDTGHHGPPYTLIAVIGVGVIVFLVIATIVAGQILGWSEVSKKRRPRER